MEKDRLALNSKYSNNKKTPAIWSGFFIEVCGIYFAMINRFWAT